MATSLQLSAGSGVKQCTSAPAVCNSAGPNGSLLHRPLADFSRTFLGATSGFLPKSPEQVKGKRVTVSAAKSAGRELNGVRIPRAKRERSTASAAAGLSGVMERATENGAGQDTNGVTQEAQMKRCAECQYVKPLVDFQKAGKGLRRACRACVAVELAQQGGKEMYHMALPAEEAWARAKQCSKCGVTKELRDYAVNKRAKDGVQTRCRACNAAATPEASSADGAWTSVGQPNNELIQGAPSSMLHSSSTATAEAPPTPLSFSEVPALKNPDEALRTRQNFDDDDEAAAEAPRPLTSYTEDPSLKEAEETIAEAQELVAEVQTVVETEPLVEGRRNVVASDASDTIAALQVKLLRLDFDLANARANKAIFDDQVQYLQRVMANRNDDNDKLRSALTEASSSVTALEEHVNRLETEGRNLRGKLLRMDFDLVHARSTKAILGEKVDDLERAIAADSEATRLREEQLSAALEDATSSNAALKTELEAIQSAASDLRVKALNFSLDLSHANYGKNMLGDKVEELERMLEADREAAQAREEHVNAALEEASLAINELERLRQEGSSLRSKLLRSDFDLAHASAHKALLNEKVEDFEKAMEEIREEEAMLKAAFERVEAANAELESQVEALQTDGANLRSQVLKFSLDLAHTNAVKKILGDRVDDLERAVEEHDQTSQEQEERLKVALAEASSSIAEVERLREEGSMLRGMILRLDLDLAHARAHKQILGNRVEDLETEAETLRHEDGNMKNALAEAIASNAALEAEVALVQAEGVALRNKVLRLSLDIAHDRATKQIMEVRVEDLEKQMAEDAIVAQAREEELQTSLTTNTELETDIQRLSAEGDHFKTQVLRRDFDIQHTLALKKIFEERVQDLERVIESHDDAHAKLKEALSTNAELATNIDQLDQEKGSLLRQVLMKDFDLTHANYHKSMLSNRVSDLELAIETHEDLGTQLAEEKLLTAELQQQTDSFRIKLLRQDFDLTNIRAMKRIFENRLQDLERVIEMHDDMGAKLKEANYSIAELESQVAHLDKEKSAYQVKVLSRDFDLTHTRAMKSIMDDRVSDLERVIEAHDDLGTKLKESQFSNAQLQAEVERLDAEKSAVQTNALRKDFDITHTRAMKALLDNRVEDLERVIAAHEDLGAKLQESQLSNAQLQAEVERLDAEKSAVQTNMLRKDFDITHTRAMKALLDDRVQDLERVIAAHDDLGAKLKASQASNAELQAQIEQLEEEKSAVQTQMLRKEFDITHTRAMKALLDDRVQDLERAIAAHDDLGAQLMAARSANSELQANIRSLEEKEGALQSKLLRKDFDLAHIGAMKAIFEDRVDSLERSVVELGEVAQERFAELKMALAEVTSSTAELERLRAEGSAMQLALLTKDFDLSHARAGKVLMADKVDFLERMVANYEEVTETRDKKLLEALSLIEELEAQRDGLENERGTLRSKLLRQDFDLTHALATRAILSNRVDDLEAAGDKLAAALEDAHSTNAELEEKVAKIEAALVALRKEERTLRTNQTELKRQVVNLQVDNGVLSRAKTIRTSMLAQKERQLATVEAALERAQKEEADLVRQLAEARSVPVGIFTGKEPEDKQDPSVAWVRRLKDVREDQARRYEESESESDGEGPSVGKQLAKIASLTAAVRREEEAAQQEADDKAKAEENERIVNAADDEDDDDTDDDDDDEHEGHKKVASRTYQAAGASLLLSTVLGTYMLWAPNVESLVQKRVAASGSSNSPTVELVAPNPVEQLTDLRAEEKEERTEETAEQPVFAPAEASIEPKPEDRSRLNPVEEVADAVKATAAAATEAVEVSQTLVDESQISETPAAETPAAETEAAETQVAETPKADAEQVDIAEPEGAKSSPSMVFTPSNEESEVKDNTPADDTAAAVDSEDIADCTTDMC